MCNSDRYYKDQTLGLIIEKVINNNNKEGFTGFKPPPPPVNSRQLSFRNVTI